MLKCNTAIQRIHYAFLVTFYVHSVLSVFIFIDNFIENFKSFKSYVFNS